MKNSISIGQELHVGDILHSNNGNYKAVFQEDSNFVVYKWEPVWASNTYKKDGERIIMQHDGNLVMYSKSKAVWHTNTHDSAECSRLRLTLTNDGHLVLEKDGVKTWSS
uniref:Bulb-type lectin domain-containing protein n=1 Tax=Esox lucius TaxID=8010 RepID=A0AAY5L6Y1_ESOLU